MARNRWIQVTAAKISCPAATLLSLLQVIAPAGIREAIVGVSISFDGISNVAQPVLVELYRTTTAGTFTANNPVNLDSDIATGLQVTGGQNATVEPTKGARIAQWLIHPQSGMPMPIPLPEGEIILPAATRMALCITAPAIVNASAEIRGEE